MVNNLVGCEQPLSAIVVVIDTCPHLDLDTAHDIPAEALLWLAFCTDGNDYSVLPYGVGMMKTRKDTVKKCFDG